MSSPFTIAARGLALASALAVSGCGTVPAWPDPKLAQFTPTASADPIDLAADDLHAGRPGLAIESLQKALAMQPQSDRALSLLGTAYNDIGRHDLARAYFLRALALKPDSGELLHNVGYSYYLEQDYDNAAVYLRRALASGDEKIEPMARGRLMVIESRMAEAEPSAAASPRIMLRRTGERTYELKTLCAACASPVSASESAQVEAPAAAQATMPRYEISNGAGREKLAARIGYFLSAQGLAPYYLTNAPRFDVARTTVVYPAGEADAAARVAASLPLKPLMAQSGGDGHVRLILGADILDFDSAKLQSKSL